MRFAFTTGISPDFFRKLGMDQKQIANSNCGCSKKADRYISFDGIDCNGNAQRVIDFIEQHLAKSGHDSTFWDYFMAKRKPRSGLPPDDLFLVHSHINQIRELFEEHNDEAALSLLSLLEEECC